MNRDQLLTKLAMEMSDWPTMWDSEHQEKFPEVIKWQLCHSPYLCGDDLEKIYKPDYLQRRAQLINCPPDSEAPEGARWKWQDANGGWSFWYKKPDIFEDDDGDEICWCGDVGSPCAEYNTEHEEKLKGAIPAGHRWQDTLTEINHMTTTAHEDQYAPDREIPNSSVVETYGPHKWTIVDGAPTDDFSDPDEDAAWDEHKAQLDRERAEQVKELGVGDHVVFPSGRGVIRLAPDVNNVVIVEDYNDGYKRVALSACEPIRTDRERWIEAASLLPVKGQGCIGKAAAEALYDAGLAKLPGDNHEAP